MTTVADLLVLPLLLVTLIAIAFALNSLSLVATTRVAGGLFVFDLVYVAVAGTVGTRRVTLPRARSRAR